VERSVLSRIVANTVHKYVYTDGAGGKGAPRRHQSKHANARHKRDKAIRGHIHTQAHPQDKAIKAKVTSGAIKKGAVVQPAKKDSSRFIFSKEKGSQKERGKHQQERSQGFPRSSSSSSKERSKKGRLEKSGARHGHHRKKADTQGGGGGGGGEKLGGSGTGHDSRGEIGKGPKKTDKKSK